MTWGSLEQRLRRVFLTSLVRSTPRTQSANECRLVSQLILPHPPYREVACERAKCRRLRGRWEKEEVGKSLSWKARTPYLLHDQNTPRIWYAGHAWPPHTTFSSSELRRKALPSHPAPPRHLHAAPASRPPDRISRNLLTPSAPSFDRRRHCHRHHLTTHASRLTPISSRLLEERTTRCVYRWAGRNTPPKPSWVLREAFVVLVERTAQHSDVTSYLKTPRTYDAHVNGVSDYAESARDGGGNFTRSPDNARTSPARIF